MTPCHIPAPATVLQRIMNPPPSPYGSELIYAPALATFFSAMQPPTSLRTLIVMLINSEFTVALFCSLARCSNVFLFSVFAVKFIPIQIQDLDPSSGLPSSPYRPLFPSQPGEDQAVARRRRCDRHVAPSAYASLRRAMWRCARTLTLPRVAAPGSTQSATGRLPLTGQLR